MSAARLTPPISSATRDRPSGSMSVSTTRAPSAANRRAIAAPMPLPAPVTTATLPSSFTAKPPLASSDQGHAAVDLQRVPGDERGRLRRQVDRGGADLGRPRVVARQGGLAPDGPHAFRVLRHGPGEHAVLRVHPAAGAHVAVRVVRPGPVGG